MLYLGAAIELAESRGFLDLPEVRAAGGEIPVWFRSLGTAAGIAEFEMRRGFKIPAAIREFYQSRELACFLEKAGDGEYYFNALASIETHQEMPPIVQWSTGPHLIVSYHTHSGMVIAAKFGQDDPFTFCGFRDEPEPFSEEAWSSRRFSELIFKDVENHEARLDYWQYVYETSRTDPVATRRNEWIRHIPGMGKRLDPT